MAVPPAATVLAFTDGLVERRGEDLDASLERGLHGGRSEDDTAIVGLRWIN